MRLTSNDRGYTLVEIAVGAAMIGVIGLLLYSVLNLCIVLGAKNAAVNVAHQNARTAMTRMLRDLHAAVSLPYLVDTSGNQVAGNGPAAGISFQEWSGGPHLFNSDAATGQNQINIKITAGQPIPVIGQRVIVPTHQIEEDITAVSGTPDNLTLTLARNLPVAVAGTSAYSIVCFITDRCSYTVTNGALGRQAPALQTAPSVVGHNLTDPAPFSAPTASTGALYSRFVAGINVATIDPHYSNRALKSANILLNGQVPIKGQLTTYQ
jgi:type II secretory pathway pseudopilin PulG